MRTIPAPMKALWEAGGPFIGSAGAPNGYVTVEPGFYVTEANPATADTTKWPFRWWVDVRPDATHIEVLIPNIRTITIDRSLDADAATCDITMANIYIENDSLSSGYSNVGNPGGFGIPGYFTSEHGNPAAAARWGQVANPWSGVLEPNALLRVYQGWGGWTTDSDGRMVQMPLHEALEAGYVIQTGTFLIDEVVPSTDGTQTIKCRDMMKLLIEQPIYLGLIPILWYPLSYRRYDYPVTHRPPITTDSFVSPVITGPGGEGPEFATDVAGTPNGKGYWVLTTDGGVFPFGPSGRGWGSRGGDTDTAPMVGMDTDPNNNGYWLATANGGIFPFGNVEFYGAPAGGGLSGNIIGIAANPAGGGYWCVSDDGHVYAFGSAVHYGDQLSGWTTRIVDICPTSTGLGYWLLDWAGHIFTFGDAQYHGGAPASIDPLVGMAGTKDDGGYWLAHQSGVVDALGNAKVVTANVDWPLTLDPPVALVEPIMAIAAMPTSNGYTLVDGAGTIYTFGDAGYFGDLPTGADYTTQVDATGVGSYMHYEDIVKDIVRWCGFLAWDGGVTDDVFGTLEATGAWSNADLPKDMFDKQPSMDVIKKIREVVGFVTYADEDGGFQFRMPNWYALGNLLEDNSRTTAIPVIDERVQLTNYQVPTNDQAVRSKIVIGDADPAEPMDSMVFGEKILSSPMLRGMQRPALWINSQLTDGVEITRMINLVVRHLDFAKRPGVATAVMNPAIQLNDQVRIYERQTAETAIHYVRGIRHQMSLGSDADPSWLMQLTTSWLGEADDFVLA